MTKGDGRLQKLILMLIALTTARLESVRARLDRLQKNSAADANEFSKRLDALSGRLDRDAAVLASKPLVPRLLPQLAVLLTAFGVLLYVGFRFQPDDASLTPFGTQELMFDVPVKPVDGTGRPVPNSPTFNGLLWTEAHGQALDGYDIRPLMSLPDPDPDTIRVLLLVSYDGPLPTGSSLSVSFDIPANAELQRCETIAGFRCQPVDRTPTAARSSKAVQVSGTLGGGGVVANTNGLIIAADLKEVPGLAFTYSRTRAIVRQPTISLTGTEYLPPPGSIRQDAAPNDPYPYVSYPPTNIVTQAIFDTAPDFQFSETPGSTATDGGDFTPVSVGGIKSPASTVPRVTWAFQQPIMPTTYSPPHITGTNPKSLDDEANDIFIAGIIFGIAGGAAVNAIQLFVTGVRRRSRALRGRIALP